MKKVIITAPSLDPAQNVSGVSSVVQFIITQSKDWDYLHFQIGKTDNETGLFKRVRRIWHTYKDWKKMLREYTNALIHYSFPLSTPSILRDPLFMRYALCHRRKMVVHIHGGLYLTAQRIPFLQRNILRRVFAWNVPFIVLSESEKEILLTRWGAKRVEVLPNCPDAPAEQRVEQKEKMPLVLGYLGRIEVNKGMTELLEACKKLKADSVMFQLQIAGKEVNENEYIPVFKKELGEDFEYVGLVSGEEKINFLSSLDILVMPTYFEGLPMSLLECMSYGVVPVITNVGSINTVVRPLEIKDFSECRCSNDVNGLFVNVKDVKSIVEAVKFLDSHRDVLHQLSENSAKTIAKNLSPKNYVERLNEIYNFI